MSKYNSSFWYDDFDTDDSILDNLTDTEKKSLDLYKLASSKRAISNFVNIVTNESIPVQFKERGDSYTDGKTVVIGSKIEQPKDFDVAVGLALHEGSHIKLSNFKLLNDLYNLIPTHVTDGAIKKGIYNTQEIVKNLWNYVEDRRIDNYVFKSAPGYRDYYRKMYDKYFNDKLIDKALLSDEHTNEDINSYLFRIINLHNKNTNLSALKGLRKIYRLVGLNKISRLKTSQDSLDVALEIFKVILSNMNDVSDGGDETPQPQKGGEGEGSDGSSDDGQGSSDNTMSDEDFNDLMDSVGKSPIDGGSDETPTGGGGMDVDNLPDNMDGTKSSSSDSKSKSSIQLSDRQKELLKKKIEKQKKFLDGDIQKKSITKSDSKNLNSIEESGSEIKQVGNGTRTGYWNNQTTPCIVVKRMTKSLYESELFPMTRLNYWNEKEGPVRMHYQDSVDKGIKLGSILGKKLQVRGEDRSTVFNRQKIGKIDKRMISSLGFGNENVFQFTEIDSYKKANLHISVDASSSMGGSKWDKTMTNVVAICKAVDMIPNLQIQVTFRLTQDNKPYIVMAYDSRVDKFSKVKNMFGGLGPSGTTPEGLCFEAIQKEFVPINNDMDSYFLNISDGQPYFPGNGFYYGGETAEKHTNKMVKMIESMGIQTLAYFVTDWEMDVESSDARSFKRMYGKGAKMIDVNNVNQITKTMNELFLAK
jgi:hypothetical protein|tara:strand:+ start:8380 stop:10479 length:2100 start_codon:yes stop_codon:yes gene_type:complete